MEFQLSYSSPKRWCCESAAQIYQQIKKTQQWPQDWKGSFSFQFQKKAMQKIVQTPAQLHPPHKLAK